MRANVLPLAFLLSRQKFIIIVGLSFMTILILSVASQACATLTHVHPLTYLCHEVLQNGMAEEGWIQEFEIRFALELGAGF